MVIAVMSGPGRATLLLGLTTENIRRLGAGLPASVDLGRYGLDLSLTIIAGETEESIAADLQARGLMGPATRFIDERPRDLGGLRAGPVVA